MTLLPTARRDGLRVRHRTLQRFRGTAASCKLEVRPSCFALGRLCPARFGADRARPTGSAEARRRVGLSRWRTGSARLSHCALEDLRWFVGLATDPVARRALGGAARGAAWRQLQRPMVAPACAGRGDDSGAAALLRGSSVGDKTGATYAANWAAFCPYSELRGRCPMPATTTTVVECIGWQ